MKLNSINLAIATACLTAVSTPSYAMYNDFPAETTTCTIFKNNKLLKKPKCRYEYTMGNGFMNGSDYYFHHIFEIKNIAGYGKFKLESYSQASNQQEDGSYANYSSYNAINGKKANVKSYYRHPKTYKILSDSEFEKLTNATPATTPLLCYSQGKNKLEICLVAIKYA